jgi:hypothetical protein
MVNESTTAPTTPAKPAIEQPTNPIVLEIVRNDATIKFTEGRTVRGANAGNMKFEPDISDKDAFLKWIGVENLVGLAKQKVTQLSVGWAEAASDEDTGVFNENNFVKFATDFSSSGETMGELKEQLEDLLAKVRTYDFSNTSSDAQNEFIAMGKKIQDLTININNKKRNKKDEAVAA